MSTKLNVPSILSFFSFMITENTENQLQGKKKKNNNIAQSFALTLKPRPCLKQVLFARKAQILTEILCCSGKITALIASPYPLPPRLHCTAMCHHIERAVCCTAMQHSYLLQPVGIIAMYANVLTQLENVRQTGTSRRLAATQNKVTSLMVMLTTESLIYCKQYPDMQLVYLVRKKIN